MLGGQAGMTGGGYRWRDGERLTYDVSRYTTATDCRVRL